MMPELSMHLMDLIENSVSAGARAIDLFIDESTKTNVLSITVVDDGKGMDEETLKKAVEPLFSTKKGKGWGLGLPLFKQTTEQCNGTFEIRSAPGRFTEVSAVMQFDHIDRPPLGNMTDTIISLLVGHPNVELYCIIKKDDQKYEFDTRLIKEALDGLDAETYLGSPEILQIIGDDIANGLTEIGLED